MQIHQTVECLALQCIFILQVMSELTTKRSEAGEDLSQEERNLLSVAYKNVVGSKRSSWRVLSGLESKYDEGRSALVAEYKDTIKRELEAICTEVTVS